MKKLEKNIEYKFKNENLLQEALTHRSYTTENKIKYDNQRLEFLGDAVVQIIVTDYLYKKFKAKAEGELTALRSALVKREGLAKLARVIELDEFIILGKGETEAGGNNRDSVLCDAFEALMGALYLDSGISVCRKFLLNLIKNVYTDIANIAGNLNPKGYLQEITQRLYAEKPEYKVIETVGPEHNMIYVVEVSLEGEILAVGKGRNIKTAEKAAAQKAVSKLEQQ